MPSESWGGKESMNSSVKKEKGFTIIEVVLVLAIAALIFLIIFLALPALQRSQRDQARRGDMGRLVAAVQSYQSNNSGSLPFTVAASGVASAFAPTSFVTDYLDGKFNDPSANTQYAFSSTNAVTLGQISIFTTAATNTDCATATAVSGGAKKVIKISLEQGGSTCQFL